MIPAVVFFILFTSIRTGSAAYGNSGGTNNEGSGSGTKYRVQGVVSEPFLFDADANGKYSGFIIGLLDAMKGVSNGTFDYSFTVGSDNTNGDSMNGVNTGLIKDLVNNVCDIGAADMTVRVSRHQAVDFLQPFVRSQGRISVNNPQGQLGSNPTFFIAPYSSIINFLTVTPNATLKNIYNTAKGANRVVASTEDGLSQLLASSGPAAYIDESPGLTRALLAHSDKLSLTSEVLYTAHYAFAVQLNKNDLRVMLNILLLKVQESGESQKLLAKYNIDF